MTPPRAGGIPSLVSNGETGLLYAPSDLEDAVRATRAVLGDAGLRDRLGRSAREVVAGWDWRYSIEQVEEMVRGVSAMILGIRGIEESSVYQDIFAKGEAKGLSEGRTEGRIEEARAAVRELKLLNPDLAFVEGNLSQLYEDRAAVDHILEGLRAAGFD